MFIPLNLKKFRKEYKRQTEMKPNEVIEEINNQKGYNKLEYDVNQIKNVADTWKQADKKDIVKGLLFLISFLGFLVGFVVCMMLEYMIWGFVCFGLGAGEIILALIIVKLLQRRSIKLKRGRTYKKAIALVLGSTISSQSTTGSKSVSVGNTIYKVYLKIKEDKFIAYSKEYYSAGEKVDVNIDVKKPKIIHIIGCHEEVFDFEENKF